VTETTYKGFAGVQLRADVLGFPEDPAVLLLHGGAQTRDSWKDAAAALVLAGRYVINLDLRGHGASEWPADGRYNFDSYVGDLRQVLDQLGSRPVIVAASLGGWVATAALGEEGANLASGLVLVDAPPKMVPEASREVVKALHRHIAKAGPNLRWDPRTLGAFDRDALPARLQAAAANIIVPTLFVRGAQSELTESATATNFVGQMPNAEYAEIEGAGHLVAADRAEAFNALLLDFLERKIPRAIPDYRAGSDARTLRDALGCFATGVTVVTTRSPAGDPVGLTANSYTSVSLDPPLLLVCIARSATTLACFEAALMFAVNVLHIGHQPASNRFARRTEDRFAATPWESGENGAPLLLGTLASFECERHALFDGGDHVILVGRVLRARYEPRRDPLLYFRGKYRRLHLS
jgi:flavin reductase (DIM6/NTAB) family NADH-FMN oxidoreductase RutF/pimeloyl-ACP methyl ester carboxylesterase